MESMDARLVEQALNYHGEQLQKAWQSSRNENELALLNLKEPSFEIYQQRKKTLSLADTARRLKLQQFIAKKADVLYNKSNLEITVDPIKQHPNAKVLYAIMPGLDSFVTLEKSQRIRNLLESLVVGDVIYAQVMGKSAAGLLLKILCNCSDCPRVVPDLGVKALILNTATVPAVDKKGVTRGYMVNDLVCVCVSEVNVDAERVIAVMNVTPRQGLASHPPLGLIQSNDLPEAYMKVMDNKGGSFESIMENSTGFANPNNIKYLCDLMSLGQDNYSNMIGLREKFPPNEYGVKLRQAQASKWAFRSVAQGIDHFKAGRHSEAFQCLNKALVIDPLNDEGLVSRGCLYATCGSLKKAIDDFEMVLKLNQTHASARKYLAETLVALGRSHEEERNFEEAQEAYEKCLVIAPNHEVARNAIEFIRLRALGDDGNLLDIPNSVEDKNKVADDKEDKKKHKIKRKSRSKKRQRWSSTSSSSSNDSSRSESSSSSSSNSRSSSKSPSRQKKPTSDRASLSPLSKRMALYNNPPEDCNELPNLIFPMPSGSRKEIDYEVQVRKFLDQTKNDSDHEEKVRIFFNAASRWKKEREKEKKYSETDKSRKRKKKERKAKDKEEKKSRKKKKKEERRRYKGSKEMMEKDTEMFEKSSLSDLQHLESKLTAYYAKVQRKPIPDIFEEQSQLIYPEPKMSPRNKLKATQAARQKDLTTQNWQEFSVGVEDELEKKQQTTAIDKSLNIRKQMHYELAEKRAAKQPSTALPSLKEIPMPSQSKSHFQSSDTPQNKLNKSSNNHGDKFELSGHSSYHPPEPPSRPSANKVRSLSRSPRTESESDTERRTFSRKRTSNGRSIPTRMSRSGGRSRNFSSSESSRSSSPRRSRSYSDKSRKSGSFGKKYSRSYSRSWTRSQSRSRSRSSSRSRSRSGERRYRRRQTRHYDNRGGYYNPRFQSYSNNPNHRGGQNFQNGNRFYNNHQNNRYNNRRGFHHRYNNYHSSNYRGRGGQNRGGRFFHNNRQGFRDFRDNRRDFRDRRSYSRDRYSDRSVSPDPMRKVDEAKKKINKILESGDDAPNVQSIEPPPSNKIHEGPLSEGEEREYVDYKRCSQEDKSENKVD